MSTQQGVRKGVVAGGADAVPEVAAPVLWFHGRQLRLEPYPIGAGADGKVFLAEVLAAAPSPGPGETGATWNSSAATCSARGSAPPARHPPPLLNVAERYAVKEVRVVDTQSARSLAMRARIDRIARLPYHENIVRHFGTCATSCAIHVVMDYVAGGSMASLLAASSANVRQASTKQSADDFVSTPSTTTTTAKSPMQLQPHPSRRTSVGSGKHHADRITDSGAPAATPPPLPSSSSLSAASSSSSLLSTSRTSSSKVVPPLPEVTIRRYARHICAGVAFLHQHGIVHRDIKGANCLIGSDGKVKLTDFGSSYCCPSLPSAAAGVVSSSPLHEVSEGGGGAAATPASSSSPLEEEATPLTGMTSVSAAAPWPSTGSSASLLSRGSTGTTTSSVSALFAPVRGTTTELVGTSVWMSPESIKETLHEKCDIWSLGCTIVEMATGRPPWSEARFINEWAAMFHVSQCQRGPPIPSWLSPVAHDFLTRCCFVTDVEKRWSAAECLAHPFLASEDHVNEGDTDVPRRQRTLSSSTAYDASSRMYSEVEVDTGCAQLAEAADGRMMRGSVRSASDTVPSRPSTTSNQVASTAAAGGGASSSPVRATPFGDTRRQSSPQSSSGVSSPNSELLEAPSFSVMDLEWSEVEVGVHQRAIVAGGQQPAATNLCAIARSTPPPSVTSPLGGGAVRPGGAPAMPPPLFPRLQPPSGAATTLGSSTSDESTNAAQRQQQAETDPHPPPPFYLTAAIVHDVPSPAAVFHPPHAGAAAASGHPPMLLPALGPPGSANAADATAQARRHVGAMPPHAGAAGSLALRRQQAAQLLHHRRPQSRVPHHHGEGGVPPPPQVPIVLDLVAPPVGRPPSQSTTGSLPTSPLLLADGTASAALMYLPASRHGLSATGAGRPWTSSGGAMGGTTAPSRLVRLLSEAIVLRVFSFLEAPQLVAVEGICRDLRELVVAHDRELWESLFVHCFGAIDVLRRELVKRWKSMYRDSYRCSRLPPILGGRFHFQKRFCYSHNVFEGYHPIAATTATTASATVDAAMGHPHHLHPLLSGEAVHHTPSSSTAATATASNVAAGGGAGGGAMTMSVVIKVHRHPGGGPSSQPPPPGSSSAKEGTTFHYGQLPPPSTSSQTLATPSSPAAASGSSQTGHFRAPSVLMPLAGAYASTEPPQAASMLLLPQVSPYRRPQGAVSSSVTGGFHSPHRGAILEAPSVPHPHPPPPSGESSSSGFSSLERSPQPSHRTKWRQGVAGPSGGGVPPSAGSSSSLSEPSTTAAAAVGGQPHGLSSPAASNQWSSAASIAALGASPSSVTTSQVASPSSSSATPSVGGGSRWGSLYEYQRVETAASARSQSARNPLVHEFRMVRHLEAMGVTCVPRVIAFADNEPEGHASLVTSRLGPSLHELLLCCGNQLSLHAVAMIAERALLALSEVHARDVVHGSIAPSTVIVCEAADGGINRRHSATGAAIQATSSSTTSGAAVGVSSLGGRLAPPGARSLPPTSSALRVGAPPPLRLASLNAAAAIKPCGYNAAASSPPAAAAAASKRSPRKQQGGNKDGTFTNTTTGGAGPLSGQHDDEPFTADFDSGVAHPPPLATAAPGDGIHGVGAIQRASSSHVPLATVMGEGAGALEGDHNGTLRARRMPQDQPLLTILLGAGTASVPPPSSSSSPTGRSPDGLRVFFVNFSRSRIVRDPLRSSGSGSRHSGSGSFGSLLASQSRSHLPSGLSPVKTPTYEHQCFSSLYAQKGCTLSPRDDVVSLAYVLAYLGHGGLPWIRGPASPMTDAQMMMAKSNYLDYLAGTPSPWRFLHTLLRAAQSARQNEVPDTSAALNLIRQVLQSA